MKDCILHIGQSKTGTSAIQEFLHLNRKKLKNNGILYPGVKYQGVMLDLINHNCVADSLTNLKSYPEFESNEYFRQFSEELKRSKCNKLLLSGEHFFGGEPRVWNIGSREEYFDLYSNKLKQLNQLLVEYSVTVIVYLRSPIEWVESAISQIIRYEGLIGKKVYHNDKQTFEMLKPTLNYEQLLDLWSSIIEPEKLICIPYQVDEQYGNSSVTDFIRHLGVDEEVLLKESMFHKKHKSLSREYIEFKKKLNNKKCSKYKEWLRIYCMNKASSKFSSGKKYKVSGGLRNKIKEYYSKENKSILKKYLNNEFASLNKVEAQSDLGTRVDILNIVKAKKYFYKEYYSFSSGLKYIELIIKKKLRTHLKLLHVFLYKSKVNIKNKISTMKVFNWH